MESAVTMGLVLGLGGLVGSVGSSGTVKVIEVSDTESTAAFVVPSIDISKRSSSVDLRALDRTALSAERLLRWK